LGLSSFQLDRDLRVRSLVCGSFLKTAGRGGVRAFPGSLWLRH
jgi:hypothetical protein